MTTNLKQPPLKLLKGVCELFLAYGYRSLSMLDIATKLSISKKTLYQYVLNKEDLILHVFYFQMQPLKLQMDEIRNKDELCFQERFSNMVDVLVLFYQAMHYKAVLDADKFYPDVYNAYCQFKKESLIQPIEEITELAKQSSEVRSSINSQFVTECFFLMIEPIFQSNDFLPIEHQIAKVKLIQKYHFDAIKNNK